MGERYAEENVGQVFLRKDCKVLENINKVYSIKITDKLSDYAVITVVYQNGFRREFEVPLILGEAFEQFFEQFADGVVVEI